MLIMEVDLNGGSVAAAPPPPSEQKKHSSVVGAVARMQLLNMICTVQFNKKGGTVTSTFMEE